MLRVVVFSKLFWPEGGGAEFATYLIVKDILSKYFDVVVVSSTEKPGVDALKRCRYVHWPVLKTKYKPIEWLKLLTNTRIIRQFIEEADAVYIPSHTLLPLAIAVKAIKQRVKVVIHLHNYQLLTYTSVVLAKREPNLATDLIVELGEHGSITRALLSGVGHYVNLVNRLALYYADRVICVSRGQLEILSIRIPILRGKAVVIYNPPPPIPESFEKKPSQTPSILYVGGGSFVKGFNIAVKALAKAVAKNNCRVYLAGTFTDRESILFERLRKKLYGNVIVLGRVSRSKLIELHRMAWALVFPSICEEPLPYAVVESCLLGTLPIAARVGGVPEIVESTPAEELLFEPGNVEDLISKIETVMSMSREELVSVSYRLQEMCRKKFDAERIAGEILKLFTSL